MLESSELTPIYLYWSPDNRHLSVLLQRAQTLELHLLDAAGQEQPRQLLVGQPLYWSWAPDGQTLAVHLGDSSSAGDPGWVGLLHLDQGGAREERFGDTPGQFRAPAWSPDGRALAYAALGGGVSLLTVRDASGSTVRLASGATDVAFSWAPTDGWLAFAFGSSTTPGVYQGLEIVRADGTERRRLSQDLLLAFAWSPDGQRLALVTLDRSAQALSWSVVGLDGKSRVLASFVPTSDFAFQLPFFDQYAQSSSVWSADGRKLVYGAQGGGERSNGSAVGERLMVLDADGQVAPSMLARGSVGVWSPRER
jgi:TolB protein